MPDIFSKWDMNPNQEITIILIGIYIYTIMTYPDGINILMMVISQLGYVSQWVDIQDLTTVRQVVNSGTREVIKIGTVNQTN